MKKLSPFDLTPSDLNKISSQAFEQAKQDTNSSGVKVQYVSRSDSLEDLKKDYGLSDHQEVVRASGSTVSFNSFPKADSDKNLRSDSDLNQYRRAVKPSALSSRKHTKIQNPTSSHHVKDFGDG